MTIPAPRKEPNVSFSQVMQSVTRSSDGWSARIGEDWLQGRSAFGGIQAAVALRAMRQLIETTTETPMPLRAMQVTFVAPVRPGPVTIGVRVLRKGGSVIHVEAELTDGESTLCRLVGVFGAARESALDFGPAQTPVEATDAPVLRYVEGKMPRFMQHFDARWLRGDLPFSGGTRRDSVIELGFRETGMADETHVMALADFIPPIALSMFDAPTPGSSLTWMIDLLCDRFDDLPLQGWRIDAELIAARLGYTQQSCMLWGPRGVPVALSRQCMVVFG